jgi:hypothetical protein
MNASSFANFVLAKIKQLSYIVVKEGVLEGGVVSGERSLRRYKRKRSIP